ncbi:hypothetical protein PD335_001597 [Salmonella enterica]|uniref:Lipoprotein n=1 Tax=Salmonella enterica subsp. enterica serovar Lattenkamp TaxID=2564671 RepID=A0A5W2LQ99_SALET|nr:hypothetical protein [Salmonella enterica subsp. enterica serovar Lattenkamp]EAR5593412.1 hypothetical protein [Salmonella enterica]ECJ3921218.1 hypothetical protein [Salmonella enterica subsp. enterica]EHG3458283.1 hypothetical protein [Salmonella enterica subsp. enterica serovar Moero]EAV2732644.1 hypothetical protein [Salmonella enterica]
MIIEKKAKCFLIMLILLITGCDEFLGYQEPPFVVYGDESILKDTIINVSIIVNDRNHPGDLLYRTQSLLYKGDIYPINFRRDDDIVHYVIFYSYKNKINTLSFDAVIPRLKIKKIDAQVIAVRKYEGGVYIEYYGSGEEDRGLPLFVGQVVIPQNEYLEKKEMYRYGEQFSLNYFHGLFRE